VLLLASAVRCSGAGDEYVEVESGGTNSCTGVLLRQYVKLLALFFLVAAGGLGILASWRMDRAHFSLTPGVCRWQAPI
jgi:hypothetical protein